MRHLNHRQAVLLMIVTTMLWSMAGVVTRHLDSAGGFQVTFWRSFFAAVFVLGAMAFQYRAALPVKLRAMGGAGLWSGTMWSIMFTCFMIAITMTSVANVSVVGGFTPLLTAFMAWLVLRQRIATGTWLAIAVACLGMVWMCVEGFSQVDARGMLGMMVAFGAPMGSALNFVILQKKGKTFDLVPAVFIGASLSALAMLPFARPLIVSTHDLLLLAMLGFFQLGLPCILLVRASSGLSAPEISLLGMLELIAAPIWAWLGAGEVPSRATMIGGAIVLSALLFNEWVTSSARSQGFQNAANAFE